MADRGTHVGGRDRRGRSGIRCASATSAFEQPSPRSRLGPMPRGRSGGPPSPTQRERYRARVDREAAAIILQDELEAHAHGRAVGRAMSVRRRAQPAGRGAAAWNRCLRRRRDAVVARVGRPRRSTGRAGGQDRRRDARHGPARASCGSSCSPACSPSLVVVAGLTALRPLVRAAVVGWAWDNPGSLRLPFVADFIREDLGAALTEPAGGSADEVVFEVTSGRHRRSSWRRASTRRLRRQRASVHLRRDRGELADQLQAGPFLLRHNMTPAEVVRRRSSTRGRRDDPWTSRSARVFASSR